MSNEGMTFEPTIGERLIRSKARIGRLKQAIAKEKGNKPKNKERIVEMTKELNFRTEEIKEFTKGIL